MSAWGCFQYIGMSVSALNCLWTVLSNSIVLIALRFLFVYWDILECPLAYICLCIMWILLPS